MTDLIAAVEAEIQRRNPKPLRGYEIAFQCFNSAAHKNGDSHPSNRWNTRDHVFHCDACGVSGGWTDLARAFGIELNGTGQRETAHWHLLDRQRRYVATHVRLEPGREGKSKDVAWKINEEWGLKGRPLKTLPLYGIHCLDKDNPSRVILVEGEKAADAVVGHGLFAVGSVCGATTTPSDEVLSDLQGREVILWPDADLPGREHMQRISARLTVLGISHRTVEPFPGCTSGEDAADWQGSTEDLWAALEGKDEPAKETVDAGLWVCASEVQMEPISWLWEPYIALGKLTVLDGDPELGKSTLCFDLAARVTTGYQMPNGGVGIAPSNVIILSAEDAADDTIVPRLTAAGADLDRVHILRRNPHTELTLPDDIDKVRDATRILGAKFIIIDPLMAYLSPEVNAHRDQHVRRALAHFSALAEEFNCAVVVIRHLTKDDKGKAMYRGGGSIGISGAARSVLLVA
jgi:hypothetical protein